MSLTSNGDKSSLVTSKEDCKEKIMNISQDYSGDSSYNDMSKNDGDSYSGYERDLLTEETVKGEINSFSKQTFNEEDAKTNIDKVEKCITGNVTEGKNSLVTDITENGSAVKDISDSNSISEEKKIPDSSEKENHASDEWVNILGHDKLRKKVIQKGKGYFTRPQKSQVVTVTWSGTLEDGIIFAEDQELTFTVGDGDVIQAFDLCLSLMELEEKCVLETDSAYAYGSIGRSPDIPPNSNITYHIELTNIEDPPDYSKLPLAKRIEVGVQKREIGNWWYSRSDHIFAINSYNRALTILTEGSIKGESTEDISMQKSERVKCYNNLGACQLKIEAFDAAIKSCDSVLILEPENVKALFRKGKCLAGKGELELAIACLRKAIKIEPETKLLHNELSNLVNKHKKQTANAKEMYQRMLGTKPRNTNDSNSPWMLYVGGAVAAALISVAVISYRYIYTSDR